MKVKDLKLESLLGTRLNESIADAADRMRFYEVGSLAVLEDGVVVGIFTERDVVRAMADRADTERVPVSYYATSEPTTVSSETDVETAAATMLAIDVRHLPVVDGERPVGMISIRDLLATTVAIGT